MTDQAAALPTMRLGPKRWLAVLWRIKAELATDHIGLIAAGVAFFGLLAIFPAITAILAIGGLMLEPQQIVDNLSSLSAVVPDAAMEIITRQAEAVAGSREGGLGLAALAGIGIAVYSSSKGMASLIEGMNVAYDVAEERGFIRRLAVTLALTMLVILGLLCGLFSSVVIPALIAFITLPALVETVAAALAWIVLAVMTVLGLTVLYRYGPCHPPRSVRWFNSGSVAACVMWLAGSALFGVYVANFASYSESFGALAGVIILLTWLWLSAYIVLIGAEINAEVAEELGLTPAGSSPDADHFQ